MSSRTALALAILSGLPVAAPAQELIRVSYTWQEVVANTLTPITAPNSVLDAGEGARICLGLVALVNGTNAIGQITSYTPPPAPGFGTVRGIASFIYNLRGDGGASTAAGHWVAPAVSTIFAFPDISPRQLLDGALLDTFGSGQFVAPGGTANSTNPISDAFRATWTPNSYSPRTVHFLGEPGSAAPTSQHNGILIAYGITQPTPDPATWYDNHITKFIPSDFGTGINIPIVPSPATAPILVGCLVLRLRPKSRPNRPV